MYIELHAASAFSFLQGASLPETLVERAAALGYPALALLDADGVYGAPRFHKAAAQGRPARDHRRGADHRAAPQRAAPVRRARRAGDTLAAAGAGRLGRGLPESLPPGHAHEDARRERRGRARARGARRLHRRPRGAGRAGRCSTRSTTASAACSIAWSASSAAATSTSSCSGTCCATRSPTTPRSRSWRRRSACRWSPPTACASPRRASGRSSTCSPACAITPRSTPPAAGWRATPSAISSRPRRWRSCSRDRPDALAGTEALAERLEYTMADLGYRFPTYPVPRRRDRDVVPAPHHRGRRARSLSPVSTTRRARRSRTSSHLIEKLDLAGYFLIVWDIVSYCRQHDILVQGRGSAANSAVCYSLGHHRRRSDRDGAAVRALPVGGARRVARHRSRSAERRPPRAGDPARLREVRPAGRGDDRQRHHLPRPQRGARSGEGAGARRRSRSIAWPR